MGGGRPFVTGSQWSPCTERSFSIECRKSKPVQSNSDTSIVLVLIHSAIISRYSARDLFYRIKYKAISKTTGTRPNFFRAWSCFTLLLKDLICFLQNSLPSRLPLPNWKVVGFTRIGGIRSSFFPSMPVLQWITSSFTWESPGMSLWSKTKICLNLMFISSLMYFPLLWVAIVKALMWVLRQL